MSDTSNNRRERELGLRDIRDNGLEVTENVIDQLESDNPDEQFLEEFASTVRVLGHELCPTYAERMFDSLLSSDYDSARKIGEALEHNLEEIPGTPTYNIDSWNEAYHRSRDASIEFIYNTVGEIEGYDWEEIQNQGII